MRYELTITATAHGRAAMDAETEALNILRGQYDIDSSVWDVSVRAEPITSDDGTIILWCAEAYARRSDFR